MTYTILAGAKLIAQARELLNVVLLRFGNVVDILSPYTSDFGLLLLKLLLGLLQLAVEEFLGAGKLVFDAVVTRNFPVVSGAVLVTTALFTLCTLGADLLIAWLDPRVRAGL